MTKDKKRHKMTLEEAVHVAERELRTGQTKNIEIRGLADGTFEVWASSKRKVLRPDDG